MEGIMEKENVPDEIIERLKGWGKENVPNEIMKELGTWRRQARVLRVFHVLLGLAAVIASITVASRVITDVDTMSLIAWFAAITSGVLTSLGLETKSNNMRSAW